jgi:hypothetical protein
MAAAVHALHSNGLHIIYALVHRAAANPTLKTNVVAKCHYVERNLNHIVTTSLAMLSA